MAPSAAAAEIVKILNELYTKNLRYCALCLRPESERKLVEPTSFLKCVKIMQLEAPLISTICFVCEAAASKAVALFQVISFSYIINRLFKDMASKLTYRRNMVLHLDRYMESKQMESPGGLPAQSLPAAWRLARRCSALVATEVLHVSNSGKVPDTDVVRKADRDMVALAPAGCPASPAPAPADGDIELESVVVIVDDDDDPPSPPAPPTAPLLAAVLDKPSVPPHTPVWMTPPDRKTKRTEPSDPIESTQAYFKKKKLNELKKELATKRLSVPSESVITTSVDRPLVPSEVEIQQSLPTMVPFDMLLDHPDSASLVPNESQIIARSKDGASFILHPIICVGSGDLFVPSLRARLVAGQLLPDTAAPLPNVLGTRTAPQQSNEPAEIVSVGELIPCSESDPLGNTHGVPDVADSPDGCGAPDAGGPDAGGADVTDMGDMPDARAARPVEGGRVDWEDKIPMDVISFMDATDPYADQILKPADSRRTKRRVSDQVIDLC